MTDKKPQTKEMNELVYIQTSLKAPKNQRNNFGGYNYRSCEDIMEAVKPLLKEVNCTLIVGDEIVQVADRIYVKATATLRTPSGEEFSNTAFAREPASKKGQDDSQVTGAASSYARKYALNGLFCIDDTKDADALNVSKEYTQPSTPQQKAAPQPQPLDWKYIEQQFNACQTKDMLDILWNRFRATMDENTLKSYYMNRYNQIMKNQIKK